MQHLLSLAWQAAAAAIDGSSSSSSDRAWTGQGRRCISSSARNAATELVVQLVEAYRDLRQLDLLLLQMYRALPGAAAAAAAAAAVSPDSSIRVGCDSLDVDDANLLLVNHRGIEAAAAVLSGPRVLAAIRQAVAAIPSGRV
jgi:hypothetical protein